MFIGLLGCSILSYVKEINKAINNCKHIFQNINKIKFKQTKAQATILTGLPKIHKTGAPIRPLINYKQHHAIKSQKNYKN